MYEAGDEVTEEEAERFLREAVGDSRPASWSSHQAVQAPCPPRLLSIGGRRVATAALENQGIPEPL